MHILTCLISSSRSYFKSRQFINVDRIDKMKNSFGLKKITNHFSDPSKEYTGSALVAAAVGGVIIGAFAVFLLFHLKQRCRNYINGDYRRVPMEYDFELNPRLKTH